MAVTVEGNRRWRAALHNLAMRYEVPFVDHTGRPVLFNAEPAMQLSCLVNPLLDRIRNLVTQDEANSRQVERLHEQLRRATDTISNMQTERQRYDAAVSLELLAVHRDLRRACNARDELARQLHATRNAQPMAEAPRASDGHGLTKAEPGAS